MAGNEMNVGLLRLVQRAIEQTPQQFHMVEWRIGEIYPGAEDKASGTACIAGWVVVLGCRTRLSRLSGNEIERRARELLGLKQEQAERLFFAGLWPWALQQEFYSNPQTLAEYAINARLAARRIDLFIATNGEQ